MKRNKYESPYGKVPVYGNRGIINVPGARIKEILYGQHISFYGFGWGLSGGFLRESSVRISSVLGESCGVKHEISLGTSNFCGDGTEYYYASFNSPFNSLTRRGGKTNALAALSSDLHFKCETKYPEYLVLRCAILEVTT